jgi:hypothetical protein
MLRLYANKSRVKVFTQNIIGRYLCPGSRAEIAEKATGGNKEKGKRKKVVSIYSRAGGIALTLRKSCESSTQNCLGEEA